MIVGRIWRQRSAQCALHLDEDGTIACTSDVYLVPEVAGLFGIASMGRMFDTLNEVYPRLREVLS